MDFASLHNQTHYSILHGLSAPDELFNKAKSLNIKALAITELGTLSSVYECLELSKKTGIKYIPGCKFYFLNPENEMSLRHINLLAMNQEGYKNLLLLNRRGYDNGFETNSSIIPVINFELLENYSKGIICLTSCGNGLLSELLMLKKFEEVDNTILKLKNIFGDNFYIEILANNMKRFANGFYSEIDQQFINRQLIIHAKKHGVKIVPTSNTHYTSKEENSIHDALLAINSGNSVHNSFREKLTVPEFYLKSGEEIFNFFSRNYGEEFSKQIIDNTIEIMNKCESPEWILPKYSNPSGKELPLFPVQDQPDYVEFLKWKNDRKEDLDEDKLYLRYCTENKFKQRFTNLSDDVKKIYLDRIEEELDVFYHCGISSYMLIVADYLEWAEKNEITYNFGRGSVAGSLIAYLLGIHKADPIKYKLVFPRFHNKLKVAYSDIDCDVSKRRRHEVLDYIEKKYKRENVAQVSSIIWESPKVYAKDICRIFELGGNRQEAVNLGNLISEVIPDPRDCKSYEEAKKMSPLFGEYTKKYKELENNKIIADKPRAFGTHPAGIIISKRKLEDIVPIRKDKDGAVVIEVDKDLAEEIGLVKMDVLGLSTLDIISDTFDLIKKNGLPKPNINLEEYDKKTYDLISSGNTLCVFQFGTSAGTIDLCKKIKPKSIEDLAVITTLARPASKEIREDFILTRIGKKPISYLHPKLENALKDTYGYPLYDESLLILAKDVAGWDLNEADKLRKLTKEKGKNPEKVKKWKSEFIAGAINNGVSESEASLIWEKVIEPYGRYSFNLAHAIEYSFISYVTAYLKANYPVEFLLSNLMSELQSNAQGAKENIAKIKKELKLHGLSINPPDINRSNFEYTLDGKELLTGFKGIKYVGEDAIQDIIAKRPFKNFTDFMSRVDSSKVRANTIQALAAAGALDCFKITRKNIFQYCSDFRKNLTSWKKKHSLEKEDFIYKLEKDDEWSIPNLYALEYKYIGEAFICQPSKAYSSFFKKEFLSIKEIKNMKDRSNIQSFKFILKDFIELRVKKETSKYYGQPMLKALAEDSNGDEISLTIFPDKYKLLLDKMSKKGISLEKEFAFHISASTNIYDGEVGLIYNDVYEISPPPELPKDIKIKKTSKKENKSLLDKVEEELIKIL
ncbi:MAG: DNA polymerase III subunit alpha [Chitinophagales bacterium]|nr:DNA polymerase III subunit alpha [Chitinophagales bacterium]